MQICVELAIPFSEVMSINAVADCPHLNEREFFPEIEREQVGKLKYPGFPFHFSETPCRINRPAPLLGQHNEKIYKERLGYSSEELVRLFRARVI